MYQLDQEEIKENRIIAVECIREWRSNVARAILLRLQEQLYATGSVMKTLMSRNIRRLTFVIGPAWTQILLGWKLNCSTWNWLMQSSKIITIAKENGNTYAHTKVFCWLWRWLDECVIDLMVLMICYYFSVRALMFLLKKRVLGPWRMGHGEIVICTNKYGMYPIYEP